MTHGHIPVLSDEVLAFSGLQGKSHAVGIDATFGLGGHSGLLLSQFPELTLLSIDKDESTRIVAYDDLRTRFGSRIYSYKLCFSEISEIVGGVDSENETDFSMVDFVLADLGISSVQLDSPSRGMSFRFSSALDMRMDQSQKLTAHDVLNTYSERELFLVFAKGGVGAKSKSLARAICNDRPIEDTKSFHAICNSVLKSRQHKGADLATVPFQAVRIEVNAEFENLKKFLMEAVKRLKKGGRLLVISFHSLEDKLVASVMRWWASNRGKGLHPEDAPLGVLHTKKAIQPKENEIKENPRSRSAMLRVFERNESPMWQERELLPHIN